MDGNANQKVTCVAIYAYEAAEPDELSLQPGDVVRHVQRLSGGWWRGELRGRVGMFPDNFVTPLTDHATVRGGVSGRCRAVFSYQPANPDELPLAVGDVLDVLGEVEEGWWQGRRQGVVGVFPSNFVVMLDAPPPADAAPPAATVPAPALPPKPVKELCRVLFPYLAVNDDELTLEEGDIVTVVSRDAPDRGWWRGELRGRTGLFPDNFVQIITPATHDVEEKKPERHTTKTSPIYPILNKYSEKTASMKELSTSKISLHKENTVSKESSIQSTITHTNKSESEKLIHSETVTDTNLDNQVKKPPVPNKKSPTPTTVVGGLFSGLKSKMLSSDKEKSSSVSTSSESDRTDGSASTKPATNTLDHVERNAMLNDPRAARVKAPRRRPPSQALRDDATAHIPLSNGHEASPEPQPEKPEEVKPRAREWEKHKAPWMEELKLNQARKDGKGNKATGSTDRILECGVEEKRSSHSMEMSKSTSSISNKMSVVESFEESSISKCRLSSTETPPLPASEPPHTTSPTAAGRTFSTMLEEVKRNSTTSSPPSASIRTHNDVITNSNSLLNDKPTKLDKIHSVERSETKHAASVIEKTSTAERIERSVEERSGSVLDRRLDARRADSSYHDELIAQLNERILNLEKLLEVQNAKWSAAIEDLSSKLTAETKRREALQAELAKLAQCVTQV